MLLTAHEWAKSKRIFPHFSTAAVYASLLLKTGNQQKSIEIMEAACKDSFLNEISEVYKRLLKNVDKMKNDEASESLLKM